MYKLYANKTSTLLDHSRKVNLISLLMSSGFIAKMLDSFFILPVTTVTAVALCQFPVNFRLWSSSSTKPVARTSCPSSAATWSRSCTRTAPIGGSARRRPTARRVISQALTSRSKVSGTGGGGRRDESDLTPLPLSQFRPGKFSRATRRRLCLACRIKVPIRR